MEEYSEERLLKFVYYTSSNTPSLLVLGMNHYGLSSWKLIQENILPTKSIKQVRFITFIQPQECNNIAMHILLQLQLRVKNQCSKRTGDNVVKVSGGCDQQ